MKLKLIPSDFIVDEISIIPEHSKGSFHYFKLTKTSYDWYKVAQKLKDVFKCTDKDLGIAGIKDKAAITTQIISVKTSVPFRSETFESEDIKLEYLHSGSEPIKRGFLEGNKFTITVREVINAPKSQDWMINYFDDQRFSENNVKIGHLMLKKKYKEAAELLADDRIHEHLQKRENDYVGALRQLPYTLLTFFAHSLQSAIFNEYVSSKFEGSKISTSEGELNVPLQKPEGFKAPLVGFESEIDDELNTILRRYELTPRDFVNNQITAITVEGNKREVVLDVTDLKISELEENDLGNDKKVTLEFTLPKGAYATMFIKQLFA